MTRVSVMWGRQSRFVRHAVVFFILLLLVIVGAFWLVPLPAYDLDNYRYALSSVLQAQASIFALIVSSGVLLFQLSGDTSPKSLRYFPMQHLIMLLAALAILMGLDGLSLVYLTAVTSSMRLMAINLLLLTNGLVLVVVIAYVQAVVRWLRPESMIEAVELDTKRATNDNQRRNAIHALEELAGKVIQKGYTGSISEVIHAFLIISQNIPIQNSADSVLGVVLKSLEGIATKLYSADLDSFGDDLAQVYVGLVDRVRDRREEEIDYYNTSVGLSIQHVLSTFLQQKSLDASNPFAGALVNHSTNLTAAGRALCLRSMLSEAVPRCRPGEVNFLLGAFVSLVIEYSGELRNETRLMLELLNRFPEHLDVAAGGKKQELSDLYSRKANSGQHAAMPLGRPAN